MTKGKLRTAKVRLSKKRLNKLAKQFTDATTGLNTSSMPLGHFWQEIKNRAETLAFNYFLETGKVIPVERFYSVAVKELL